MSMVQDIIKRVGMLRFMVFLFGAGLIAGIVAANFSGRRLGGDAGVFDTLFLSNMKSMEIDKGQLFWLVLEKRLKDFFLLWIFSVTVLWMPYSTLFMLYQGFLGGFFLTTGVILYGLKGILLMTAYCVPQCFFYLPVFMYALMRGRHVNRRLYQYSYDKSPTKWKLFLEQLPSVLLMLIGLLAGCVLEAWVNGPLVQKTLTLF